MTPLEEIKAKLVALNKLSKEQSAALISLSEQENDARKKARLLVMAAFFKAHGQRLEARLNSMGCKITLLPDLELKVTTITREAEICLIAAKVYGELADLSRKCADYSSAWVCELNRAECEDSAKELVKQHTDTKAKKTG